MSGLALVSRRDGEGMAAAMFGSCAYAKDVCNGVALASGMCSSCEELTIRWYLREMRNLATLAAATPAWLVEDLGRAITVSQAMHLKFAIGRAMTALEPQDASSLCSDPLRDFAEQTVTDEVTNRIRRGRFFSSLPRFDAGVEELPDENARSLRMWGCVFWFAAVVALALVCLAVWALHRGWRPW